MEPHHLTQHPHHPVGGPDRLRPAEGAVAAAATGIMASHAGARLPGPSGLQTLSPCAVLGLGAATTAARLRVGMTWVMVVDVAVLAVTGALAGANC